MQGLYKSLGARFHLSTGNLVLCTGNHGKYCPGRTVVHKRHLLQQSTNTLEEDLRPWRPVDVNIELQKVEPIHWKMSGKEETTRRNGWKT